MVIVIAAAGIGAYLWNGLQSQPSPPTRYEGLFPYNLTPVTAVGITNGPGGCSGPGLGGTEYCYTFGLLFEPGSLLLAAVAGDGSIVYETTGDVSFQIQALYSETNVTFVNVTLLDNSGQILATYAPGSGWLAFDGNALPIVLWTNQTCVLNIGPTSASGDNLRFDQGEWGTAVTALP